MEPYDEFKAKVDLDAIIGVIETHHEDFNEYIPYLEPEHEHTLSLMRWAPLPELAQQFQTINNLKMTWNKEDVKQWLVDHLARQLKWLDEEDWKLYE